MQCGAGDKSAPQKQRTAVDSGHTAVLCFKTPLGPPRVRCVFVWKR